MFEEPDSRYYPGEEDLAFWREQLREPHFVYIIQGEPETPIKIGMSKNPLARIRAMQTARPDRLRLLYVIPGEAELEEELHSRLGLSWLEGGREWFPFTEDAKLLLLLIEGLSRYLVSTYDGSGEIPGLPQFNDIRSEEQIAKDRAAIDKMMLDGYWSHWQIAEKIGISEGELHRELQRMKASGDYFCFLQHTTHPFRSSSGRNGFAKLGYRKRVQLDMSRAPEAQRRATSTAPILRSL